MAALMTLNQNGQAITLSPALAQQLRSGQSLRQIVDTSPRQLVFAQTFPTGTHAMWLYYWLAAQGVHPLSDVQSVVIAPSEMSATLASGRLDGFCAGEPGTLWRHKPALASPGSSAAKSGPSIQKKSWPAAATLPRFTPTVRVR